MTPLSRFIHLLWMILFLLISAMPLPASAGADPGQSFTFIVLGDNRLPGYLRFTREETTRLDDFIKANYTGRTLERPVYGGDGYLESFAVCKEKSPDRCREFTLKAGWPDRITDTDQTPSLILRGDGQPWVYDRIIRKTEGLTDPNLIVLHTGDMIYNGYYGTDPATSPYWKRIKETFLDRLPAGAPPGLPGRFFPCMGNHETWMDDEIAGVRNTIPYLDRVGLTQTDHMYHFRLGRSLFVFLDTGGYPPPADWGDNAAPPYDRQMERLNTLLTDAREAGSTDNVFVTLHKPPFVGAGHGHLSKEKNPHSTLMPFSRTLDITVFSGHVHSTEAYLKDGIRYFVLGGGGADQAYTRNCDPGDWYCEGEVYWKGAARQMEYNFMTVTVAEDGPAFVLSRWRPDDAVPFAACEFSVADQGLTYQCEPAPHLAD